jgi:phenylalanyl-tRNA synthetase beta chain
MKVSYNWLSHYVDINCSVQELADKLTMAGIEVEAIDTACPIPEGVVVGEILERNPHPGADKLSVCKVSDGTNELQVVCGAPNCDAGKKVPLATIGTVFTEPDGKEFKIKKSKLRGEKSFGMLCSSSELGLDADHDGLLELENDAVTGTSLRDLFPGDTVYTVEITPNRPDWLSHWGIARDVSCLLNSRAQIPEIKQLEPSKKTDTSGLITVEEPQLCPRYTGRIIRNVKIAESPDWLKDRLISVGLRPINNVVDITNFVLWELGHPLHAFDLDLLAEQRIVVRRANDGEKMVMLDDSEIELKSQHLVIADAEKPVALAGIMGGAGSGVTEKTVNILLESAAFYASKIRSTSRELGISTDSSYRFERGIDWDMIDVASNRATALILELAGGELVTELVDIHNGAPEPQPIECAFNNIRNLIGITLNNNEIIDIFTKLQLSVSNIDHGRCLVTPPRFRLDIEREADLAEEIARINGLDAIPNVPVSAKTVAPISDDAYIPNQELRDQLIGLGLNECLHYSMVSEKSALSDSRFSPDDLIKMTNPLSLELCAMRPSLFGEMLDTVKRNTARKNYNLRLFELGRVFCGNQKLFPEERLECSIVLSGQRHPERFSTERDELFDFYDLKGLVEALFAKRRTAKISFTSNDDERFVPGMCATLLLNGKVAGQLGQRAKSHTNGIKTEYPIFMAVIEADVIFAAAPRSELYHPISQFPSTSRDVAFVAKNSLQHGDVMEFIRKAKLKNLENIELFDIFTDDKVLGAGKKSMAYSLTFRNADRTLTDKEVNKAFDKLRHSLEKGLGIELR